MDFLVVDGVEAGVDARFSRPVEDEDLTQEFESSKISHELWELLMQGELRGSHWNTFLEELCSFTERREVIIVVDRVGRDLKMYRIFATEGQVFEIPYSPPKLPSGVVLS